MSESKKRPVPRREDDTSGARDSRTLAFIASIAEEIRAAIDRGVPPRIELPLRSLKNVSYDRSKGWLALGGARKTRTLTAHTIKSFAQTLRLMAVSRTMVDNDDFATKRESSTSTCPGSSQTRGAFCHDPVTANVPRSSNNSTTIPKGADS